MPQETLGYVKLEWTCPKCGSRNLGTEKTCISCGAPQPQGVQFEQTQGQQVVQDEALKVIAEAGSDIHCAFCGARNPAGAQVCSQCGADLKEGVRREAGKVIGAYRASAVKQVACPHCGTMNPESAMKCSGCGAPLQQREAAAPPSGAPPVATSRASRPAWWGIAMGALVTICLVAGIGWLISRSFSRQDLTGVVQGVEWQTVIEIEQLAPITRQGWEDEIPADAQVGACRDQVRSVQDSEPVGMPYNKVCGTAYTIDTGSGVGKVVQDCQYEVLAPYCEYTVQDWQVVERVTKSGSDFSPVWPQPQQSANQRLGTQSASFVVILETEQGQYEYSPASLDEFERFLPGSRWLLTVNGFNQIVRLEPVD